MAFDYISTACQADAHQKCRVKACACPCHQTLATGRKVRIKSIENPFFNWEGIIEQQLDDIHWNVSCKVPGLGTFPVLTFAAGELELAQ